LGGSGNFGKWSPTEGNRSLGYVLVGYICSQAPLCPSFCFLSMWCEMLCWITCFLPWCSASAQGNSSRNQLTMAWNLWNCEPKKNPSSSCFSQVFVTVTKKLTTIENDVIMQS
jgi:hypothetical protein